MTTPAREIEMVWHDLTPRLLEVARVRRVTPRTVRVTLTGEDLDGFCYAAPDDHVKVFFPEPGAELPVMPTLGPDGLEPPPPGSPRPTFRDYTVRHLRPERRELDIDFVLHGHGPAGVWAAQAAPGQQLGVLGPRGSNINPMNFDWYLFAGDETALPSLAAWLEKVPAGVPVFAFVDVADAAEEQDLTVTADTTLVWLHRDTSIDGGHLERAIRGLEVPPGAGYCWVAGEAGSLKPIRRYLRTIGLPRDWVEVDGYWKRGTVNLDHHDDDED
ncbi:siderophore-interacting protein [Dactylosporangium sp. NPDC005555]|uniref:siderophore-interacting protein n=1 Tax=Dactylosporangium sp. NPDC005555 TaxID=3154889 RepID=UPI0033B1CF8B